MNESPALDAVTVPARALPARASSTFLLGGAVAIAVYFVLPSHAQSVLYVCFGVAAAAAIYVGASLYLPRGERLAWHLFAVGLLMQAAGDAIFAVYEIRLNREPPAVSIADLFYLAGYPVLAAGVVLLLRRLGTRTGRSAVVDLVIVFTGVALVQWVFFIDPYNHMRFGTEFDRLVSMAYPAMDVLLLVALTQLFVGSGGRTNAYRMLFVALGLWVVGDEIYGLTVSSYTSGGWLDAFWLTSYIVWGAAALDPSMAQITRPDRRQGLRLTRLRLGLLAAASVTAPVILIVERFSHHRVHTLVLAVGGAALALLVFMRLAGLVQTVERSRRAERTARREAEQAQRLLAFQNERLVELDRLKDEFVSGISHELRTPLTSISGYVELLLEGESDDSKRGHLQIVERNADRLLGLVADLLFAARLQEGRLELAREDVDLNELVIQAVESAQPRSELGAIDLRVEAERVPLLKGEGVRLAQMLDNLISNAIKFTPTGGDVVVRLSASENVVRLQVSDTGIGITEEARQHLFQRFFRSQAALERQIQGTGLGLYISKAIVEAHGGRIGVESGENEGTTFAVELPVPA